MRESDLRLSDMLPDTHNYYLNRLSPTPLVPVQLDADRHPVWCKLEFLNPSGSTKDRIAQHILVKAWREGKVTRGSVVVEASSGSTSIAMALACAQLGLRFIAVMPEGVSNERVYMIRAYGGEIHLTAQERGILGAIAETERLAAECGAFLPRQFANPENAHAHRIGTAREILDQIPGGTVDAIVSGVGTGGTLVGLFRGMRDGGCKAIPYYARPVNRAGPPDAECCSFSGCIPGVVECVSTILRDGGLPEMVTVEIDDKQAIETARRLVARGFPVGPSSGLNFCAALAAVDAIGDPKAHIVTVFPDRMERYFTTDMFAPFRTARESAVPV